MAKILFRMPSAILQVPPHNHGREISISHGGLMPARADFVMTGIMTRHGRAIEAA